MRQDPLFEPFNESQVAQDPQFRVTFDRIHPELAVFIGRAVAHYVHGRQ